MCGIVGVWDWQGQATGQPALDAMVQTLCHRGPDGRDARRLPGPGAPVGLGHARLRIIDLSCAADQPMANDDQSVWVVFNGEIYNYRELRAQLQARGWRFRTASDTEVLLRLYEAEGIGGVTQLEGMFAFAVWDGRQQTLWLARDRVGKKPLFYAASPARFLFASEPKAIRRHPEWTSRVNTDSLPSLFFYGYVPAPDTCLAGISELSPGHTLRVDAAGSVQAQAYWDVPLPEPGAQPSSLEDAAARVRTLVEAAVARRLVADVPLGAFLSGGLDSSIVVGVMSRLHPEPVRTFSIGFAGDPRFDETAYARAVSKRFRTAHTEFIVTPDAVKLVERLVWHHDGPFADSSAIPTYLLAELTRQHVTVALTGDGGDELFAGYSRFVAALAAERVPLPLRQAAQQAASWGPGRASSRGLWRDLRKFASHASRPLSERFSRWAAVFSDDLPELLPDACRWGRDEPPAPLSRLAPYVERSRGASALTQLLYVNLKTYLPGDLLVKMDRCTMAHALEARSPFLDRELMEYAFTLPDAMKLEGRQTKAVLRRAFADLVPAEVLRRRKMGFGVPLARWFRQDLRDFVQDALLPPEARLRRYVNHTYVQRLVKEHEQGRADHAHRLWTLLTFEVWLRGLES